MCIFQGFSHRLLLAKLDLNNIFIRLLSPARVLLMHERLFLSHSLLKLGEQEGNVRILEMRDFEVTVTSPPN